ncbi:alpha/beta fold hydrolase [Chitinophaga flava]|uniref:Alpha/beta hydrolase n=1 Tax=Chitinophaga flava TaxID=2259036 RepID=A0A365XZD6_9BACT|nr:alpha/beta hydrolase [Chitinophaga flava]RBL91739.1 alpha/beta hydrolase [Chitinophaga flava]
MTAFFKFVPIRIMIMVCLFMAISQQDIFAGQPYSFAVKKEGRGKPVIFIHGLYSSGAVWDEVIAHYRNNYTCYELTLPGFAGQPPIKADSILQTVAHELAGFIRDNKLDKPVIIGHSLGGWLALQFGVLYPNLPGKLITVSAVPFLPVFWMGPNATADSARPMALGMKNQMSTLTPEQIRKQQVTMLASMITDSINIQKVISMAASSDSPTQGQVMYELCTSDLRQEIHKIKCPILVLADWAGFKDYGVTREAVLGTYQKQYQQAPQTVIAMNDLSKHFIMYDQPKWLIEQVDSFLAH